MYVYIYIYIYVYMYIHQPQVCKELHKAAPRARIYGLATHGCCPEPSKQDFRNQ